MHMRDQLPFHIFQGTQTCTWFANWSCTKLLNIYSRCLEKYQAGSVSLPQESRFFKNIARNVRMRRMLQKQ